MRTVVLFDPGIRSFNKGDEIIMRSAENMLNNYLKDIMSSSYVLKCATHSPAVTFYQNSINNPHIKIFDEAIIKLICGSNLLWKDMFKPRPSLNINMWNCRPYRNSTLMGVGLSQTNKRINKYSRDLYGKILSKETIHSTRDERTAEFLRGLGYKAINTGCPTMWTFTDDFCKKIPKTKSKAVVFTLTDFHKDSSNDQTLINILIDNYSKIYFWVQGIGDFDYFRSLKNIENIEVIPPSVVEYDALLNTEELDYIGTRLHAGLFAMQHKKRSIILAIDNRARDIDEAYNLKIIERGSVGELEKTINSEFETKFGLNVENINTWIEQFKF